MDGNVSIGNMRRTGKIKNAKQKRQLSRCPTRTPHHHPKLLLAYD